MSRIIVNNFSSNARGYTAVATSSDKTKINFFMGYDPENKSDEITVGALSSFFLSLIIHDEIYLSYSSYLTLVDKIGALDILKLLDGKIIKIIFIREANAIYRGEKLSLGGIQNVRDPIEDFEEKTKSFSSLSTREKSLLLQYTDNAKITVPKEIYALTRAELTADLSKGTLSEFGVNTDSLGDVNPRDAYKLLRIADITQALILQSQLSVDCLVQDGFAKQYLNAKLGALTPLAGNDSVALFSNITGMKGIPDLYTLYKHKTISIDDIIACRNTFSGGLFRKWYASTDYDERKVLQALINKGNKESQVMKLARFIYPNVLGFINPIAGVAISAVDSYIVSKLVEGWSPSLFLDDVYKRKIDHYIATNEDSEKRKQIIERFGKVSRNDPCPCQSGKKFKNCHGK